MDSRGPGLLVEFFQVRQRYLGVVSVEFTNAAKMLGRDETRSRVVTRRKATAGVFGDTFSLEGFASGLTRSRGA